MNAGLNLYLGQMVRKAQASAYSAEREIHRGRSIGDVVRAVRNVHVPAQIRHAAARIKPRLRRLANERIRGLIMDQMRELRALTCPVAAQEFSGKLKMEWQILRGEFAESYRFAEREASKVIASFPKTE